MTTLFIFVYNIFKDHRIQFSQFSNKLFLIFLVFKLLNDLSYFLPQLCYYNYSFIVTMNQLIILRLLTIPVQKTVNKLFQPQPDAKLIRKYCTSPNKLNLKQTHNPVEINNYYEHMLQQPIKINRRDSDQSADEEINDISTSNNTYIPNEIQFKKNFIDKRVKNLQYEANNPCEDSLIYDQLKTIDAYTVSIFDGHGGPQLAQYSKSKINNFIECYLQDHLKLGKANAKKTIGQILKQSLVWSYQKLEDTFFEIYEQQVKKGNKKIRNVGTCGITAIVHNDKVYVGNSGDSQAIFIVKEGMNMLRSEKANDRLSVNNRAERERIKSKWAGIDDNIITEEANNCNYLKGRLQPTRTIGDYYLKNKNYYYGDDEFKGPYLSCQPDVNEHHLTSSHKYMVIASDGIWDVLNKNEVMNSLLMEKQIDLSKTCYDFDQTEQIPYVNSVLHNVLDKAAEMCGKSIEQLKNIEKGIRRNYHDDITLAVINLEGQF